MQPNSGLDLFHQLCLGPAVLQRGPEIPGTLLAALTPFQNGRILRPAQFQGQRPQHWIVRIGPVEFPHPAQVPRGEALALGVVGLEILGGHDRRPLLRAGADVPANLEVELHLRKLRPHELIQHPVHGPVISWFPDVHWLLLSGASRLI